MIMYTTISIALIEMSGIFSLAKTGILYVYSNVVSNAFAPATYVDVEINEPNGPDYIVDKGGGQIHTSDGKSKEAYIKNPGTTATKKPVLVRAKIVAVIHDHEGIAQGVTQGFEIIKKDGSEWPWIENEGYYYYNGVLNPDQEVEFFENVNFTDTKNIPTDGYVAIHVIVDTIEIDTTGTNKAKEQNQMKIRQNWAGLPNDICSEYF